MQDPKLIRMEQRIKAGLFNLHGVELAPIEKTIEIGTKARRVSCRDHREGVRGVKAQTERRVARRAVTEAIAAGRFRLDASSCDPKRSLGLDRAAGRPNKRLETDLRTRSLRSLASSAQPFAVGS